jgi:glyceraldehyde 3-phosphate dehydrogenase
MSLRIAINGFGRIGRNIMRAYMEGNWPGIEIVAVNGLGSLDQAAFLLEMDSVHGRLAKPVAVSDDSFDAGSGPVRYLSEANPADLDWGALGVDLVMECSGKFTDRDKAALHLQSGAGRVLVSAPSKGADLTVVYGINHQLITDDHKVISNASCTTNCLAPIAQALHQLGGIQQGFMTTIHSYTTDQRLLDASHADLYRARAAALNMIPTTTGAAKAVGLVLPELNGKLDGVAIRVPTPNVSAVDLTAITDKKLTAEQVNEAMVAAAQSGPLAGVLATTDRPLVSSDLNHHPASSICHLDQTRVMPGGMVRVFSWYDNEWGFSNRMLDVAAAMAA